MTRTYLLDVSGSMTGYEEEIQELLKGTFREDLIVTTVHREDPPIEVVSDVGESVEVELEFRGSTPLSEAVEEVDGLVSGPIVIVSDGMPNDVVKYKRVKERANRVSEINMETLCGVYNK